MRIKKGTIGWTVSALLLIANTVDNILTKDVSRTRYSAIIISAVFCLYCIYQLLSSLKKKDNKAE